MAANDPPNLDTIATFWKRFFAELTPFFVQIIPIALQLVIVEVDKVNLDGTKLKAEIERRITERYADAVAEMKHQLKTRVG